MTRSSTFVPLARVFGRVDEMRNVRLQRALREDDCIVRARGWNGEGGLAIVALAARANCRVSIVE